MRPPVGMLQQHPLPLHRPGSFGFVAPAVVPGGIGERFRGAEEVSASAQGLSSGQGTKRCHFGPGWSKAASTAGRGQLLAGCTSSGSSNLL